MKTENVIRVMDGVIGLVGLVGAIACCLWLEMAAGTKHPFAEAFMGFVFVTNVFLTTVNLTNALSYKTRQLLATYALMVGLIGTLAGSLTGALVYVAVWFVIGSLLDKRAESKFRRTRLAAIREMRAQGYCGCRPMRMRATAPRAVVNATADEVTTP